MSRLPDHPTFALGTSNLGLAVCIRVLHRDGPDRCTGIGQFGLFKGREVTIHNVIPFTEADVLTFTDPHEPGALVGYIDGGRFHLAEGEEADRIVDERGGE